MTTRGYRSASEPHAAAEGKGPDQAQMINTTR